ncbi:competence/damage-inducible protein A [Desulfomicrobium baculatum]|uniref:Molybdopterin binding domain protein n=1 Tax=Desulfomicrobium baculatum (strain DSM 4028 / VKM B-1378 / X) TaxID=525897 RepID=C7LTI3_DESBD|nr:competence/damage-inducible protein A [Desulfomicrobium baculatum]ACU89540.1 molybdopterin binding domain protein [Desulfomicrobium baculatum DSM 4028]
MTYSAIVEILVIGNEILIGDIQDTNTSWLCRLINSRGGHVARGTMLRDDVDEIAAEVGRALERGADVIFTSGGLGPTADDLTLSAVAQGLGLPLELHPEALRMVKEQYDKFHASGIMAQGGLNPGREKMAWLPRGSVPLFNPGGTAPGVLLRTGRTAIISLPGVPSELKNIIESSLQEFMNQTFGDGGSLCRALRVRCNDESLLEPILRKVVPRHPRVYIKSLASTVGMTPELDITLTVTGGETGERVRLLDVAFGELCRGLAEQEIGFREMARTV